MIETKHERQLRKTKHEEKLRDKINSFSGSFMNNTKWIKLFVQLSNNHIKIKKCLEKSVFDDILREIPIYKRENFDEAFSNSGIKDISLGGPCEFKEIEQLIFPRECGHYQQQPVNQNIDEIKIIIDSIGEFETEITNENLIIYGYR